MPLTTDQIVAFHAAVHAGATDKDAGWYEEREAIFAAGIAWGAADMRERAKLLAFAASDANQDDLVLFGVLRQLGADISALPGEAP